MAAEDQMIFGLRIAPFATARGRGGGGFLHRCLRRRQLVDAAGESRIFFREGHHPSDQRLRRSAKGEELVQESLGRSMLVQSLRNVLLATDWEAGQTLVALPGCSAEAGELLW